MSPRSIKLPVHQGDSALVNKAERSINEDTCFISLASLSGPFTTSVPQKMLRVREISDGLTEQQRHLLWSPFKDFSLAAGATAGKFRAVSHCSEHRPWVVGAAGPAGLGEYHVSLMSVISRGARRGALGVAGTSGLG